MSFVVFLLTSTPLSPSPAGYHEGVVELCLCAATHVDEKDIALHHYKKGLPQDDTDSSKVYDKRLVLTCGHSDRRSNICMCIVYTYKWYVLEYSMCVVLYTYYLWLLGDKGWTWNSCSILSSCQSFLL